MTISAGTRLGPYEVLAPLGAGGMGEVYRARDTRLAREVAVKVLPADVASDASRLKRFEKEARAASALNHPNIVTILDLGQTDGVSWMAMELVGGVTLRQALAEGALPIKKLLGLAAQVAEGLAKAHEAGIVHRDLKPENVMVTKDGFVKILDFGLAKLTQPEDSSGATQTPTVSGGTEPGIVMGTVGYMSPEQALGKPLDFRSDQFSFGSIVYEMATGKRAFARGSTPETLAAIIREEPEPIGSLAPLTPTPLRWIVERCLAKDPRERYASTEDLARDLAGVRERVSELSGGEAVLPSGVRRRSRERVAWGVAAAALLLGVAAGFLAWGRGGATSEPRPLMRLNLTFPLAESPVGGEGPVLALSPDGTRLVYVGRSSEGSRLYVRPMDQFAATPIPGTEGASGPFFSPDGQWVGFWADRKLKKVSLAGGQPQPLCDVTVLRGGSWGPDGTILFSPFGMAGLWRVSDKGGDAKALTTLDASKGETTHRWPQILPGGKAAIFTIHGPTGNYDNARIGLLMLETGQRRTLFEGGTDARYLPTGHLVYLRAGSLFAVPFDLKRLVVTGPPVPVLDGVGNITGLGFANYAFSPAGTLVYRQSDLRRFEAELVWVDRKGVAKPLSGPRRAYAEVRLSPDGLRVAAVIGTQESDIWVCDLTRNSWDRLTSGGINNTLLWTPDGKRIAFASNRSGAVNPFWIPIDRSQEPEQLIKQSGWTFPTSFSPDGRALLIETQSPETAKDISVLSLDGDRKPRSLLQTPSNETGAMFSPDGHWIAYESDQSGRTEVYVTAYPGAQGRWQISTEGGEAPRWSRDGRELFYYSSARKVVAVALETRPQFHAGIPKPLFEMENLTWYDVSPDGQRFIAIRSTPPPDSAPPSLVVVLGWFDDLRRRMAAGKNLP